VNTDSEERLMIAELERIIRAEEAKPEAERDHALIDDCIKEIAEIKGVKAEFSEEEVAQITDKLIQTAEKTKKRKRFVRLVAGIAAMFVIVTGVTACAVNPALINWVLNIVHMPFGSTVEQETVTYVFQGSSENYNSVQELLASNDYCIYYPEVYPASEKLDHIEIIDDNGIQILSFKFSSNRFHYTVQFNCLDFEWDQEVESEYEIDGLHFYVYYMNEHYVAYSEIEGNSYIIEAPQESDLILVIGSLRKVGNENN